MAALLLSDPLIAHQREREFTCSKRLQSRSRAVARSRVQFYERKQVERFKSRRKREELEIDHLTQVASITPRQARRLLQKHGADWPKLKREAEALKPKTDDI